MRKGRMRIIAPGKRTTAALESKFSDSFLPGWDKEAGSAQHAAQIKERLEMGQKMTPIGRSRLIPQKG